MKRFVVFLALVCSLLFSSSALAVSVQMNGENINFTDEKGNKVEAQIINSRTMVPLRKIFESLGCKVEWDGASKKITATKDDVTIILQIDNTIAQKISNGISQNIKLDSAPIIKNDRTLVPLRFIAESLDKQVGWDAENQTAIIIDYSYFENQLKNKVPALYYFLKNDYDNNKVTSGTIIRKYFDNDDNAKNNSANIYFEISETKKNNIEQNVKLSFAGNNSLMQDIINEKWNNCNANAIFNENEISYSSSGIFAKILDNGVVEYEKLGLDGNGTLSFEQFFRHWISVSEKEINVQTFKGIKNEFDALCQLFNGSSSYENLESGKKYIWNFNTKVLKFDNAKMKYFDLTKLDNIVFDNMYSRTYGLINKKVFNYDLNQDDIFYDTNGITINGKIIVNVVNEKLLNNEVDITYKATNDYNEMWEYDVKINN